MALAHAIGHDIVGAYQRSDLFNKLRNLMADWTKLIDTLPVSSEEMALVGSGD
jgi:hypothetical protein